MTIVDVGKNTGNDAPDISAQVVAQDLEWQVVGIHANNVDDLITRYSSLINEGFELVGDPIFAKGIFHMILRLKLKTDKTV